MKNKSIKLWLLLTTLFSCITANAYDFECDGLYYNINSDKSTVTLTKPTSSHYSGRLSIPENVTYKQKTYSVTAIESSTFSSSPALISVILPNTLTSLPSYAFSQCRALSEVQLGNGIITIPEHCFWACTALRSITIPEFVETIGESAFQACSSIVDITIPANVTRIEDSAFVGCKALSHITFSDSPNILKIGYGYYEGSYKGSFDECPLFDVYIGRNISNLYTSTVYNMDDVFQGHKTLTEITLGNNVTKIYKTSFQNCTALTLVNVQGNNLKEIQDYAFQGCTKLTNFNGNALNYVQKIGISAFADCPLIKEVVLPSITSIGRSAFYTYNGKLEKVFLGDNITIIPERCFYSQSSLKYAYLGSSISNIETYAFGNCSGIINIFLFSENLVTLGENAIPNTISKIYVPKPSRYDNLLKDYYRDYLITINPTSNEYSGKAPIFSYTNNVEGSEVTFDSPDLNINVGEYNTNIDVNFKIGEWQSTAKVPANYSITPANLTIIASDASRQYGEENPEFTCSFFGFKNNETQDVLTKQPIIETTATATSNVGTYPIIPYGAEARNYSITYERGKLNVTKADQGIVWEQIFDDVHVGDIIELTAESSAGLPVKYTSTDESIAEIFSQSGKKFVEFLKAGDVSIRANQEGNENYNEADRVSKSIEVKAKSILVSSLTFDYTEWNGNDNSKFQITATVLPENATNKSLEWYSSDEEIASVDQNGLVTILMPGNCIISAKTLDGSNLTAICNIRALSGTNTIELDNNAKFDIYNINGIMIYESASSEVLNSLSPGFYIIIQNGNVHKIMIQ